MTRLAMIICLVLAVTVGAHAHARMAGSDAYVSMPAAGDSAGEPCCDDQAEPQRMAMTSCAADTILAESLLPAAAAGRPLCPKPAAGILPEGREPAGPLQPPNARS
jgi:hypothetical protein